MNESQTNRFVDYFVIVGSPYNPLTIDKNQLIGRRSIRFEHYLEANVINRNNTKSSRKRYYYPDKYTRPVILDRYPKEDYADSPLSPELPLFTFPSGEVLIQDTCTLPQFFSFVLTGADGQKTFGSCLNFWEQYVLDLDEEELQLMEKLQALKNNTNNSSWRKSLAEAFAKQSQQHESNINNNVTTKDDIAVTTPLIGENNNFDNVDNKSKPTIIVDSDNVDNKNKEIQPQPPKKKKLTLYMSKSICIISHYPFYNIFKFFLTQLFRISVTPSKIPLERYISNFLTEIPLPPQGQIQVHYGLGEKEVHIARPAPNELPMAEMDFELLFNTLDIDNILILMDLVLLEKQILFFSEKASVLTQIAEIITSLIFPFKWNHVYIPMLPKKCVEFIFAPVPFIMGTRRDFLDEIDIPPEVFTIDLDTNKISCKKQQVVPNLPEKQKLKLKQTLMKIVKTKVNSERSTEKLLYYDLAFSMSPIPDEIDELTGHVYEFPTKEVRFAFFRFFVSLLMKYKHYLHIDASNQVLTHEEILNNFDSFFDKEEFIKAQPEQAQSFLEAFVHTQAFERFLMDRIEKNNENEILFLDESITEKHNRSKLKFRKTNTPFLSKNLKVAKTLMAFAPDASNLPKDKTFYYENFPNFDHSLFTRRETKELVSQSETNYTNDIILSWKTALTTLTTMIEELKPKRKLTTLNTLKVFTPSTEERRTSTRFAGANLLFDELNGESIFSRFSFIITSECYNCHKFCTESDIRSGWSTTSSHEYTTSCPKCGTRFVPRCDVLMSRFERNDLLSDSGVSFGGQSDNLSSSALSDVVDEKIVVSTIEYLSPLVLKKEIENLLSKDVKADAHLIVGHPVLFWNLIIHFRNCPLPLNFILPNIKWTEVLDLLQTTVLKDYNECVNSNPNDLVLSNSHNSGVNLIDINNNKL
ncbi:hypothetical protein ABK040_016444 [Willaertia magna]